MELVVPFVTFQSEWCWCQNQNAKCSNRSYKEVFWAQRASCTMPIWAYTHSLRHSWSLCNAARAGINSNYASSFMQCSLVSPPSHSASLWLFCTCTPTGTGQWQRWWPKSLVPRWTTFLWIFLSLVLYTQWCFLDSSCYLFGMESQLEQRNSNLVLYPHQSKTH